MGRGNYVLLPSLPSQSNTPNPTATMTDESEMWKTITGFTNYSVSSNGVVRNNNTGQRLKPRLNKEGYHHVSLSKGVARNFKIHRLVAEAFLPRDPFHIKDDVNHLDGNKTNNNFSNLEWVTRSENILHAFRTGLKVPVVNEDHGACKYSNSEIDKVKSLRKNNLSYREISKITGISQPHVWRVCNNKQRNQACK